MIRRKKLTVIVLMILFLGACGTVNSNEPKSPGSGSQAEEAQGDFIYRIVSEKSSYQNGEKVKLYAELEYVGEKEQIKIYHAASPFYFNITETTRGIEIGYPMEEPLIETTLKKGEPLREYYRKAGGYSGQDPKEKVAFMKELFEKDGLPAGQYQVEGVADFSLDVTGSNQDVEIRATVSFSVED